MSNFDKSKSFKLFSDREIVEHNTLYLDASGDQGWPKPFGNSTTGWHILAGLILTPESDLQAKNESCSLLQQYIPETIKASFPDRDYELHYTEIYNGHGIWSHLKFDERQQLINDVFDLILKLKPILLATSIKKDQLHKAYDAPMNPKLLAVRSLISKFSMYLKRKKMIGTVVYDAEEYHKDTELRGMMHKFRDYGADLRGMIYQPAHSDKLENILNTINLCPSEMSPGLQLTDFCARAIWLYREKGMNKRYQQLSSLWEQDNSSGKVYDETIVPSMDKWI